MSLPDKQLLRRNEVLRALGIDRRILTKMVEAGTLTPVYVRAGCRALFQRTQVEGLTVASRQVQGALPPRPTKE